jgi:UDP-glucuronate 4-epimerase
VSERIVVTGAAGFIGAHVCRGLLGSGTIVVGVDNFDPFYDRRIKEEAVDELRAFDGFVFQEADIRDRAAMTDALRSADAVVHLAARAGVRPSIEQPELYESINVGGTATLLEVSKELGVRRFILGSSSSVYGDDTPVPFREDQPCMNPISPYAATKRANELQCHVYTHLHHLRIAALRFFTVYGPRQRPDLAIHRFTRLLSDGEAIPQYGDGSSERDYTYVDDIVQGVLGAIAWSRADEAACEIFNLGESKTVRLDAMIGLIADAVGVKARIERLPTVPGDVRRTRADVTKAKRVLGYEPRVGIEEGIPRFVAWYEAYRGRQS